MIFHPGAIALLVSSVFIAALIAFIAPFVFSLLHGWDIKSSSAGQLAMERKTFLVSTVMKWVLVFQILSAFLFIFTADDMHRSLLGAMCATGSLNANPIGWSALFTKISAAILACVWLAINHADERAEDYPLIRIKYIFLLIIAPIVALDAGLQAAYFAGLDPKVISSCCGALFGGEKGGVSSSLAALPSGVMMYAFYSSAAALVANALAAVRIRFCRFLSTALATVFLPLALASVISFIAPYYYQIPTHRCPFDILQSGYYFIGYPLYLSLFGGTLFVALPGIVEPFAKISSLSIEIPRLQRKWLLAAVILIVLFLSLASGPILFSSFRMAGY